MSDDLITFFEEARAVAVQDALDLFGDVLALVGDKPLGFVEGDSWDRLEFYLDLRDNPAAQEALIQQWAAGVGRPAAEAALMREANRCERELQRHGWRAVYEQIALRRLRRAKPAVAQALALARRPKATLVPSLPPYDDVAVFSGQVDAGMPANVTPFPTAGSGMAGVV